MELFLLYILEDLMFLGLNWFVYGFVVVKLICYLILVLVDGIVYFFFLLNEVYLLLYIFVEFILLFELLLCLLFKEFCREKFFENSLLLVYNLKLLLFMLIRFIVLFNVKGVLKLMLELLRKL